MNNIIENLINGNLKTAKSQARRYSYNQIEQFLIDDCGQSCELATANAMYLKGIITFQRLCDIEEKLQNQK